MITYNILLLLKTDVNLYNYNNPLVCSILIFGSRESQLIIFL